MFAFTSETLREIFRHFLHRKKLGDRGMILKRFDVEKIFFYAYLSILAFDAFPEEQRVVLLCKNIPSSLDTVSLRFEE